MPTKPTAAPAARTEPELFQSVEQWMDSAKFQELMRDEFPEDADSWLDPISRRNFLALSGASVALATGCNPSLRPASPRQVVPYVNQPDQLLPGVPLFFATAMPQQSGVGLGLLVKSVEGRPIKCEGNPNHPGSLGSIELQALAAPLTLHDPDRSKAVTLNGNGSTFDKAITAIKAELSGKKGDGVVFLTEPTTSPTVHRLMADVLKTYPAAKWVRYEPVSRANEAVALAAAFAAPVSQYYKLDAADVILSLDADFLTTGPGAVRYARDFGARRKLSLIQADHDLDREHDERRKTDKSLPDHIHPTHATVLAKAAARMNRLYVVEGALTSTGGIADHRLPLKPSEVEGFTRALAAKFGLLAAPASGLSDTAKKWVEEVYKDLLAHKGKAVVIAGEHQSAATHLLALAINEKLGAFGTTVAFSSPLDPTPATTDLKALAADMTAGKVGTLFLLGVNPVYDAPENLKFADALAKVKTKIHYGLYADETAVPHATWHVPAAHFLESWGDVRGHDGTASVIQPLIAPMHGGKTLIELLATILGTQDADPLEAVKATWRAQFETKIDAKVRDTYKTTTATGAPVKYNFDRYWEESVRDGVLRGSAEVATPGAVKADKIGDKALSVPAIKDLEIQFRPDPVLFDGKQANNGWLQELPKPMTNLTWDNAAMMSPATAEGLKFEQSFGWTAGERGRTETDFAELTVGDRKLKVAVHIVPMMADDLVVLHLGFGRERAGRVGSPEDKATTPGFNAYKLRTTDAAWTAPAAMKRLNERFLLAVAGAHSAMESRRPVRHVTLKQFEAEEIFAQVPSITPGEFKDIRALTPGTVENFEMLDALRKEQRNADATKPYKHPHRDPHHDDEKAHEDGHGHHDKRLKPLSLYVSNPIRVNGQDANLTYRRWAMTIDLGACIGCAACTLACVAENNIPVLGKDQVTKGRAMHWIRLDRYFSIPTAAVLEDKLGAEGIKPAERKEQVKKSAEIRVHVQPVPCQQCEKAPCEVVCPVGATVHSADGLNDMAYNRCVGTRYCSNNCPYKVRRFNFLQYTDYTTDSMKLVNNPEVTVRTRGVMEKCTYCVQRIRAAVIEAEREWDKKKPDGTPVRELDIGGRPKVYDGEILTACQQACPTQAITFGDLNDDKSRVIRTKAEPHNYGLLAEVNTMPRTSYLAAVRNPNPNMPQGA